LFAIKDKYQIDFSKCVFVGYDFGGVMAMDLVFVKIGTDPDTTIAPGGIIVVGSGAMNNSLA